MTITIMHDTRKAEERKIMKEKQNAMKSDPSDSFDPQLYNGDFFKTWGAENEEYTRCSRLVADLIYEQYRPQTVLDLGCGSAFHSGQLISRGAEVICADLSICPSNLRAPEVSEIHEIDLRSKIPSDRFPKVDLVICLDVAEHLPEANAATLIENCTRFSDLVVFSAAPENQGGTGHINEQPRRYWINHFENCNFRHCRRESGYLDKRGLAIRDQLTLRWMITQIGVYRCGAKFPYPEITLPPIPS